MTHRVLLIDDDESVRIIAEMSLTELGDWEVLTASGGEQGLETAKREQPDAILLDVMMPVVDGPTTLQRLMADPEIAGIPVVFMTAKVMPDEIKRLLALGAKGVIMKPFEPELLSGEVHRLLGHGA